MMKSTGRGPRGLAIAWRDCRSTRHQGSRSSSVWVQEEEDHEVA